MIMIKIVSKNLIKEDKIEEFKSLMKELVEKSSAEEGNIHYSLNVSRENPRMFAFIEIWRDQEAIDKHNATEHFQRLVPMMRSMREDSQFDIFTDVEF
jgi:quinol monooxygenase YgiN